MAFYIDQLSANEIKMFSEEEMLDPYIDKVVDGKRYKVLGAFKSTHLFITKPKDDLFQFYNRHHRFSYNAVVVVDMKGYVRGYNIGVGRSHDNYVYKFSQICDDVEMFLNETVILGDAGFLGNTNIVMTKSTARCPQTNRQLVFVIKKRIVVEHVFGQIKSKFKIMGGRMYKGDSDFYVKVIGSVFWLHNYIKENK